MKESVEIWILFRNKEILGMSSLSYNCIQNCLSQKFYIKKSSSQIGHYFIDDLNIYLDAECQILFNRHNYKKNDDYSDFKETIYLSK